jgi:hypothetical protein
VHFYFMNVARSRVEGKVRESFCSCSIILITLVNSLEAIPGFLHYDLAVPSLLRSATI